MCDYSLDMYGSRPAREDERYVVHRFASGSIGLASVGRESTPVCVDCDASLLLEEIPVEMQDELHVGPREEATFIRLDQGLFRDGVRFKSGKEVSLQRLKPGIAVTVVRLLKAQKPVLETITA